MSTLPSSQKFNRAGRFISIIAVQGQRRSIIISPESVFNGGWDMLAQKIKAFINRRGSPIQKEILQPPKMSSTLAETTTRHRWPTKNGNLKISNNDNRCIKIVGFSGLSEDILNRCLVGCFSGDCYLVPTIAKVRRWVLSKWGNTVGVFDMNGFQFLFEFPSRASAEQVKLGHWSMRQATLDLSWWTPTSGCIDEKVEIPARVRRCLSKNIETGPSRPYVEARAREVQSLGRDEGLNFKHLTRGEESADTCFLKEVQLV
ncbi:hypothetical protein FXO38_26586 [Capsicum annuum]|nr:hypothetical protein FXO37_33563 [Capsicum annuum]KAF3631618.1 hypothetical protein FXO38_26586 [Capsicum annuum]